MVVVIQCAGTKSARAGYLSTIEGKLVKFVANPDSAPNDNFLYRHPDDMSDQGVTWREVLEGYNKNSDVNPDGLLPAYSLYAPPEDPFLYQKLVNHFGAGNIYVLSAGWGLINANFLTPSYDITFSRGRNVEPYKRRGFKDSYQDFCLLPKNIDDQIVFCGSKSYIQLFCTLTRNYNCRKVIYYNSVVPPRQACGEIIRFQTTRNTNWHYELAKLLLTDEI